MATLHTNGLELWYETFGEGAPLVLIMGIGQQGLHWPDAFCERLAARGFQVIRFDHRDTGESTHLDEAGRPNLWKAVRRALFGMRVEAPYTLSDMATDVAGLIAGLGHESAHVLGVSMGGMVAQVLAAEHPGRVRTLTSMMSTTGAKRFVGRPRVMRAMLRPPPRSREAAIANALEFFELVGGPRYPIDESMRERVGRAYDRCFYPRGFLRQLVAIVASGNRTRALRQVTAPTLVIHGSADPLIPLAAGRATARAIPGAELWVIDGLGHHLPEAIWPELIDRLATHAGRHDERQSQASGKEEVPWEAAG